MAPMSGWIYVGNHFRIDTDKLDAVVALVQADYPDCTFDDVISVVDGDWPGREEYQQWLDEATPQEIAAWVGGIYTNCIEPTKEA